MIMLTDLHHSSDSQSGFTLIEMMIVVVIIGILAAIAIPAYQLYITRAQVSEAASLLGALKQPLAEYGVENNAWPTAFVGPNDVQGIDEISVTLDGKYSTVSNTIEGTYPNGTIKSTINTGLANGKVLTMITVNGGSVWACGNTTVGGATGTATTIDGKYLPNACKP